MNPIELIWSFVSFVKRLVRRDGPRDEASAGTPRRRRVSVAAGLAAVTPELAASCFQHCAYCQ